VGQGTKIDNLVQIGHNNVVGNHVILCGQAALAGSCVLEDYVVLGGGVGVADHLRVGKGARAGAHSGIGKDVPPGTEVWGFYAEERQLAFRSLATYRRLPELAKKVKELENELKELKEKK
jgi:UDP-3-O-[3-hydroxymyristoyl] glucosamine N-acyltransferase